jgi:diguanylate cyclase (GGDEF)-like protein/PAS domain S-box-containing protein
MDLHARHVWEGRTQLRTGPAPGDAPVIEGLGHSASFLAAVLAHSSDLVVLLDEHGYFRYVSEASRRMLGSDPDGWVGRNAFELVHPDDLAAVAESFVSSVDGGAGIREPLPLRVRHADGSWRDVEIVANNLLRDPSVRSVIVNVRDLTERRAAERHAEIARRRFEQAFDRSPLGMAITTLEGRYLRVNGALCDMLGHSPAELLTRTALSVTHPDDVDATVVGCRDLLVGESGAFTSEKRFVRADGAAVWARAHVTVLEDEDDQPVSFLSQIEDIEERKRLVERLVWNAQHDPLTGLLDRAGLEEQLILLRARGADRPVGVLFIDLDDFKAVNDGADHAHGDDVLRAAARRLSGSVRGQDLTCRFGGDEFVVVCPDPGSEQQLVDLAERVRRRLREPILLGDRTARVSASIGVAVGQVDRTDVAIREADAASYAAKAAGRDAVVTARERDLRR